MYNRSATGNRLTRFSGVNLAYDADGNLTRRYHLNGSGSVVSDDRFFWNSLAQMDSTIVLGTNGCRIPLGYDGFGRPHPVRGADGTAYYDQLDDPGNVVGLTDASNQVVARFRYDPWGQSELNQSLVPQPLGYQAAHRSASGLVYLRNRWYDPALGRFLSEDPLGLAGGINRYAFLSNAPMDARDPNGLCPQALVYDAESNSLQCPSGGAGATLSGITATVSSPSSRFFGSLSRGYTESAFFGSTTLGRGGCSAEDWGGPSAATLRLQA